MCARFLWSFAGPTMSPGILGTLESLGTQVALGLRVIVDVFYGREEIRCCPACGKERDAALEAGAGQGKCGRCSTFLAGAYFGLVHGHHNLIRTLVFRRMHSRPAAALKFTLDGFPLNAFLELVSNRGGEKLELKVQGARGGKRAVNKQSITFWNDDFIGTFFDFGTLDLPSAAEGKGMRQFKVSKYDDLTFITPPLIFTYERSGRTTASMLESLTVSICIGVMTSGGDVDFAQKHPFEDVTGRRESDLALSARRSLAGLKSKGFAVLPEVVTACCNSEKMEAAEGWRDVDVEVARRRMVRAKEEAAAKAYAKQQEDAKAEMAAKRAKRARK